MERLIQLLSVHVGGQDQQQQQTDATLLELNLCADSAQQLAMINGGLLRQLELQLQPLYEHWAGRLRRLDQPTRFQQALTELRAASARAVECYDRVMAATEVDLGLRWQWLHVRELQRGRVWLLVHLFRVMGMPLGLSHLADAPLFALVSCLHFDDPATAVGVAWVLRASAETQVVLGLPSFASVWPRSEAIERVQALAIAWVPPTILDTVVPTHGLFLRDGNSGH